MCQAMYRETDGELSLRPIGCSCDAEQLLVDAQRRLWLNRELLAIQPCLLAIASAVKAAPMNYEAPF